MGKKAAAWLQYSKTRRFACNWRSHWVRNPAHATRACDDAPVRRRRWYRFARSRDVRWHLACPPCRSQKSSPRPNPAPARRRPAPARDSFVQRRAWDKMIISRTLQTRPRCWSARNSGLIAENRRLRDQPAEPKNAAVIGFLPRQRLFPRDASDLLRPARLGLGDPFRRIRAMMCAPRILPYGSPTITLTKPSFSPIARALPLAMNGILPTL